METAIFHLQQIRANLNLRLTAVHTLFSLSHTLFLYLTVYPAIQVWVYWVKYLATSTLLSHLIIEFYTYCIFTKEVSTLAFPLILKDNLQFKYNYKLQLLPTLIVCIFS